MPATVTLTGKAGPGLSVTAAVFPNVVSFLIEADKNMITLFRSGETISPIAIDAATTVTATKAGSLWTLTIS